MRTRQIMPVYPEAGILKNYLASQKHSVLPEVELRFCPRLIHCKKMLAIFPAGMSLSKISLYCSNIELGGLTCELFALSLLYMNTWRNGLRSASGDWTSGYIHTQNDEKFVTVARTGLELLCCECCYMSEFDLISFSFIGKPILFRT
jgi:hypothetical protein